jgi:hypothetical protein
VNWKPKHCGKRFLAGLHLPEITPSNQRDVFAESHIHVSCPRKKFSKRCNLFEEKNTTQPLVVSIPYFQHQLFTRTPY